MKAVLRKTPFCSRIYSLIRRRVGPCARDRESMVADQQLERWHLLFLQTMRIPTLRPGNRPGQHAGGTATQLELCAVAFLPAFEASRKQYLQARATAFDCPVGPRFARSGRSMCRALLLFQTGRETPVRGRQASRSGIVPAGPLHKIVHTRRDVRVNEVGDLRPPAPINKSLDGAP